MSRNGNAHPGRSVEFLSRLHDGELDAAERARFEVHRGHCAECRRAAREFGEAISLFRSARSTPPRGDLAARILHKVQTANRPRPPFSRRFRMNLGWTGLLATALLALLIMTPIASRDEVATIPSSPESPESPEAPAAGVPTRPPIPATLETLPDSKDRSTEQDASPPESARGELRRQAAKGTAREKPEAKREGPGSGYAAEPSASVAREDQKLAAEGEAAPAPAPAAPRVAIEEADGFGPAPALASPARLELAEHERGREYILVVDAQGVVREVLDAPTTAKERAVAAAPAAPPAARDTAAVQNERPRSLYELRFEPGNRPRRLRVRID